MLTYTAAYKFLENGVHGEVLDFPGVITVGSDLTQTRKLLAGALVDMAETSLIAGEALPSPDPSMVYPDADLIEPIHLFLNAATEVKVVPTLSYEAA